MTKKRKGPGKARRIWTPGEKANTLGAKPEDKINMPFEGVEGESIPYEPGGGEQPDLASGLVILAATIDHPNNRDVKHPIVIFRFMHPEGEPYGDVVLVVEEHELILLKQLANAAVDQAIVQAALANGNGPQAP